MTERSKSVSAAGSVHSSASVQTHTITALPVKPSTWTGAPEAASGFRLGYRTWFDGLRGVAILAVIAFHYGAPGTRGGFLGVDLFFVLSGFLITALLYQEWQRDGNINLKHFYTRRALRLLPALLIVAVVVIVMTGEYRPALYALFYCANWVQAFAGYEALGVLTHTWSLSIEEQFYLLWPLGFLVMLKLRLRRRTMVWLLLAMIVAVAVNRAALQYLGRPVYRVYNGFDTRADALLIGCLTALLACWQVRPQSRWGRRLLDYGAIAATLLLLWLGSQVTYLTRHLYYGLFTVVAAAAGVIIFRLLEAPPRAVQRWLEHPALVWIGRVSYGLYLWHLVIFFLLRPDAEQGLSGGTIARQLGVLLAVVTASYYLIERPSLKLKRRFGGARESS